MFRNLFLCALAVAASIVPTTAARAQYSRITPMVEMIRKARPSVVGIFLPKADKVNGTGAIIDKRGIIVTNHHVVGKLKNVVVRLYDGTKLDGEVILNRPDRDLAFVRVKTDKTLVPVKLKEDSDILLGETVVAIGHPYGYTDTISAGIISAVNREIEEPTGAKLTKLLQTTAAINPGNSGGPLFNIDGTMIGVNVAVREDAQGIAFSIHCMTVWEVMKEAWPKKN